MSHQIAFIELGMEQWRVYGRAGGSARRVFTPLINQSVERGQNLDI